MEHKKSFAQLFNIIAPIVFFSIVLTIFILFWTTPFRNEPVYDKAFSTLLFVDLILIGIILIVEIISIFFDKTATFNTIFFALFCLFCLLTDSYLNKLFQIFDIKLIETINLPISILQFFFYELANYFLIRFFVRDFQISNIFIEKLIFYIVYVISFILFVLLTFLEYQFIAYFILLAFNILVFVKIYHTFYIRNTFNLFFMFPLFILIAFSFLECAQVFHISLFHIETFGISSILYLLIAILFDSIYLTFAIKITKSSYDNEKYKTKAQELQNTILLNQINPHFIFNSLNVIKVEYAKSIHRGNRALNLLSNQLRSIVDSHGITLIDINEELKKVLNYIELENLKVIQPFHVVFDIEAENFKVPYLSILTMVENCVLHSGINTIPDGQIEIITREEDKYILLQVKDNGYGFNTENIRSKGVGIKNTKERFELLLSASFTLTSKENYGTCITIKIPKKKGVDYENTDH